MSYIVPKDCILYYPQGLYSRLPKDREGHKTQHGPNSGSSHKFKEI